MSPGSAFFLRGRIRIHVFEIPLPQLCLLHGNLNIILIATNFYYWISNWNYTYFMTYIYKCIHGISSCSDAYAWSFIIRYQSNLLFIINVRLVIKNFTIWGFPSFNRIDKSDEQKNMLKSDANIFCILLNFMWKSDFLRFKPK